jgi:hypothetical protein
VVSLTSLPLHPRENSPQYLPERRLGESQSGSGHCGAEKKSLLSLSGNKPIFLDSPDGSLVTMPAELCQKNKGPVKVEQGPIEMDSGSTHRSLPSKRTPFQDGTGGRSHM